MITLQSWIDADRRVFRTKKKRISDALKGSTGIVSGVSDDHKEDIFYMLCFCVCVPQSKAAKAEEAIEILKSHEFYKTKISLSVVSDILQSRVRFAKSKSARLVDARKMFLFTDFWDKLKQTYETRNIYGDVESTRRWLVKTVNGFGLKLSSHFMRNIGIKGKPELAILDVHVMAGLYNRGLIPEQYTDSEHKVNLNNKNYYDIEIIMRDYAAEVGVSLQELDLLLWSQRTGYIGK